VGSRESKSDTNAYLAETDTRKLGCGGFEKGDKRTWMAFQGITVCKINSNSSTAVRDQMFLELDRN
jgi:hypothetical protein